MNIITTIARILLGVLFTFAGSLPFIMSNQPPQPGLAGTLSSALIASHWMYFIAVAQLTLGVLLLINRYVPVALIILAGFLYNSFAFHITVAQSALFAPIIVLILGAIVAMKYRALFAPLFVAKPNLPELSEKKIQGIRAAA